MIKNNKEVYSMTVGGEGFGVIQQIKYMLIKIRNLKDTDEGNVLIELCQAEVYVCLADLAMKDYK